MNFDTEIERITKAMGWTRKPTARITASHNRSYAGRCYANRWHITMKFNGAMTPVGGVVLLIHELAHLLGPGYNAPKDATGRNVHGEKFILAMREIAFKVYGLDISCDPKAPYRHFHRNLAKALEASKWAPRWYEEG
jgi:hypothetical protein